MTTFALRVGDTLEGREAYNDAPVGLKVKSQWETHGWERVAEGWKSLDNDEQRTAPLNTMFDPREITFIPETLAEWERDLLNSAEQLVIPTEGVRLDGYNDERLNLAPVGSRLFDRNDNPNSPTYTSYLKDGLADAARPWVAVRADGSTIDSLRYHSTEFSDYFRLFPPKEATAEEKEALKIEALKVKANEIGLAHKRANSWCEEAEKALARLGIYPTDHYRPKPPVKVGEPLPSVTMDTAGQALRAGIRKGMLFADSRGHVTRAKLTNGYPEFEALTVGLRSDQLVTPPDGRSPYTYYCIGWPQDRPADFENVWQPELPTTLREYLAHMVEVVQEAGEKNSIPADQIHRCLVEILATPEADGQGPELGEPEPEEREYRVRVERTVYVRQYDSVCVTASSEEEAEQYVRDNYRERDFSWDDDGDYDNDEGFEIYEVELD